MPSYFIYYWLGVEIYAENVIFQFPVKKFDAILIPDHLKILRSLVDPHEIPQ